MDISISKSEEKNSEEGKGLHILVVDDEPRLLKLVKRNLESVGYKVTTVEDGNSAITQVARNNYDLIILDLTLPDIDGMDVCRQVREFSNVPIIMLTARTSEVDKVKGLDLGADDYLTKPFAAPELLARVRAVLRRTRIPKSGLNLPVLQCGKLVIDFAKRRVTIDGNPVRLSPTEYKLLYELSSNPGKVLLHSELLRKVWGSEYGDEVEYLRVYIRYLRQKIEDDPANPKYLMTEPGIGYFFSVSE